MRLLAAAAFVAIQSGDKRLEKKAPAADAAVDAAAGRRLQRASRRVRRARPRPAADRSAEEAVPAAKREKPDFDVDLEEEAALTEAQREMIAAIRAALDVEDRQAVLRLVRKMQSSKEWPDGVPKSIKMAAVAALGWFGSAALPELAGFLLDGDAEVAQAALESYEEMLSDFELSDRERAEILVQASKVISDAEGMDGLLMELNNMRNAVAVDAIKQMMAGGSEATKSVLPANIEFFTGDEDVKTEKQLDQWLEQNPDGEDDEEFYGGLK